VTIRDAELGEAAVATLPRNEPAIGPCHKHGSVDEALMLVRHF
jgi:hypothetical protein